VDLRSGLGAFLSGEGDTHCRALCSKKSVIGTLAKTIHRMNCRD
jgi:hypothetical protein